MATVDWSPFQKSTFILPLLTELSDWRKIFKSLKLNYSKKFEKIVFIADFPG